MPAQHWRAAKATAEPRVRLGADGGACSGALGAGGSEHKLSTRESCMLPYAKNPVNAMSHVPTHKSHSSTPGF